jgi:hypothetical protein
MGRQAGRQPNKIEHTEKDLNNLSEGLKKA